MTNKNGSTFIRDLKLDAIADNYRTLVKASGKAKCSAVVKANAYGCGINSIVPTLLKAGCGDFFVADAIEGAQVRKLAKSAKIYVLNGYLNGREQIIKDHELIPVINSDHQLKSWQKLSLNMPYALQIDTGMNRLGITHSSASEMLSTLHTKPALIISHFANADIPEDTKNAEQLECFLEITKRYPDISASIANSAAILSNPDAALQLTRPGLALYGANPFVERPAPLKTAVTIRTQILDIREIGNRDTVSYGATFQATAPIKIAVCGFGYADGYPRGASGHGVPQRENGGNGLSGFINGHHINSVGRMTMDLTMFDVSDVPEHKISAGDWVELIGENISIENVASCAGTISYEILTQIGGRYNLSG